MLTLLTVLIVWGGVSLVTLLSGSGDGSGDALSPTPAAAPAPRVTALPVPALTPPPVADAVADTPPAPAAVEGICAEPAVSAALEAGDDAAAIAAAGGAAVFREAVARGAALCIDLSDPARLWAVVNKQRPYSVPDHVPASLVSAGSMQGGNQVILREDAAAALQAMADAARAAGAEFGVQSGYRSFGMQQSIHDAQVARLGAAEAELVSARPGYSEHQSGLAADVVSCVDGCGTLDGLAGSAADRWIRTHAWEYGWIVRYEDGYAPVTGYAYEPWHLRYLGHDLARAYHDGGFHSLEEFFELPPAPAYPG
ncbi:M15 family metallopeptidase [Microbacterium sp. zg.Y1090]|uniref:M15 family metallopeptidase n=1 Tax=Microbacterium TaxID=33882 RepID=UPI00214BCA2A|nr:MULTISPECIES: M15 family metallopeptidase [unclassified Microbacterium]MCR2813130.1 M15 family metallopeptidase [Microbacterium sp. zg.Y1084]MCR2819443.1 M15 family metallopeptidase [Microbacterium sp. zg.Y1090]WIM28419.1 M15 family metallopeptidase [Microbacterium sp. zg-Y1090]